jgi:1,4-dihydroxy-2-naphthoate octaprenyltransferase
MNKQSSKVNVRQYNGVNRSVKWIDRACLTLTLLLCLFILLLCLPHCIVWHSLYCSVYGINRAVKWINRAVKWMSDNTMGKQSSEMNVRQYNEVNRGVFIHFTALFTLLYCLTFTLLLCFFILVLFLFILLLCLFILLLCLPHCIVWMNKQSSKVNVRQYNGVNRSVKWINRAVKWMSDNIMEQTEQ